VNLKRVCLVSCVKTKRTSVAQAKALYTSTWFKKAREYAEREADAWYILSAKHGLLRPEDAIAPYEQTLKRMSAVEKRRWVDDVLTSLRAVLERGDHAILLAGTAYRGELELKLVDLGVTIEVPLKGLTSGRQLQWLKQRAEKGVRISNASIRS